MKDKIEAAFHRAIVGLEADLRRWLLAIDDPEAILTTLFQHSTGYSGLDIHILDHAQTELGERLYAEIWNLLSGKLKTYLESQREETVVSESPKHNIPRNFAMSAYGYPLLTFSITGHFFTDERSAEDGFRQSARQAVMYRDGLKNTVTTLRDQMTSPLKHVHSLKDMGVALFQMKEYRRLAESKIADLTPSIAEAEKKAQAAMASLERFQAQAPAIDEAWEFWREWFIAHGYEERSAFWRGPNRASTNDAA